MDPTFEEKRKEKQKQIQLLLQKIRFVSPFYNDKELLELVNLHKFLVVFRLFL